MVRPSHILIVDDSPEDCVMYQRHLEQGASSDFTFRTAYSAAEGLKQCKARTPDCVLLDFNLPDSDGLDFLSQLRGEYGENEVPVVMLTGQGNESVAVQAMKLGAQDYLVKGLTGDDLRHSIQKAIDHMDLRRQVEQHQKEVARLSEERAGLVIELEQRTAALLDADRRKNEFLAVLAHELRNPLGPIRNAAQIIRLSSPSLPPASEQARDIIDRQVGHMARLIDDLLDVSRIVRGKIILHSEGVDFGSLVRTVVEDHRGEFENANQLLTVDAPSQEIWVNGDATRLSQVIGNILDNSRKFTPSEGSVNVSLHIDHVENAAVLKISDSGEGVDEVTLERMFEIFSQADRSLDRSRGGLGLGLAIVKGITELHGGKVVATSNGPGQGCEIRLTLPLAVAPLHRPNAAPELPKTFATLRVLIVEDNRDAAESLRVLLEKLGHQVAVARTGKAALDTARNMPPELVICDIGLSDGMSGYGVAQSFRSNPSLSSAYLVALTGYGQAEDRCLAREAGFDLHLTKPVTLDTLMELPSRVIQRNVSVAAQP